MSDRSSVEIRNRVPLSSALLFSYPIDGVHIENASSAAVGVALAKTSPMEMWIHLGFGVDKPLVQPIARFHGVRFISSQLKSEAESIDFAEHLSQQAIILYRLDFGIHVSVSTDVGQTIRCIWISPKISVDSIGRKKGGLVKRLFTVSVSLSHWSPRPFYADIKIHNCPYLDTKEKYVWWWACRRRSP